MFDIAAEAEDDLPAGDVFSEELLEFFSFIPTGKGLGMNAVWNNESTFGRDTDTEGDSFRFLTHANNTIEGAQRRKVKESVNARQEA